MTTTLFFSAAVVLAAFVIIRRLWLLACIEEYSLKAAYWCWRTKQTDTTRENMEQLWPTSRILWDPLRWDLRRYVIFQGLYDEMEEFIGQELERKDIDWAIFNAEKEENAAKQPPEDGDQS